MKLSTSTFFFFVNPEGLCSCGKDNEAVGHRNGCWRAFSEKCCEDCWNQSRERGECQEECWKQCRSPLPIQATALLPALLPALPSFLALVPAVLAALFRNSSPAPVSVANGFARQGRKQACQAMPHAILTWGSGAQEKKGWSRRSTQLVFVGSASAYPPCPGAQATNCPSQNYRLTFARCAPNRDLAHLNFGRLAIRIANGE